MNSEKPAGFHTVQSVGGTSIEAWHLPLRLSCVLLRMADVLDIENQDEFEEFGVDEDGDRES